MLWILLSFLTALFASGKAVFSKKGLQNTNEYIVAWALRVFALPILLGFLWYFKIPEVNPDYWIALLISGSLNVVATILYMKAIKASDLSITTPLTTFTPLFLLLTSPIILGEYPGVLVITGVILIVIGSYILNLKSKKQGILEPFKALMKERGARLMFLVALIWSITSNFDKIGVQNSSSIFWAATVNLFIAIVITPIAIYKARGQFKQIKHGFKHLSLVGISEGLGFVTQMTAISLTLVPYVISIKRTAAIMSVIFGYFIFKEKGIRERLAGVIIMVIGVLLITLFN